MPMEPMTPPTALSAETVPSFRQAETRPSCWVRGSQVSEMSWKRSRIRSSRLMLPSSAQLAFSLRIRSVMARNWALIARRSSRSVSEEPVRTWSRASALSSRASMASWSASPVSVISGPIGSIRISGFSASPSIRSRTPVVTSESRSVTRSASSLTCARSSSARRTSSPRSESRPSASFIRAALSSRSS